MQEQDPFYKKKCSKVFQDYILLSPVVPGYTKKFVKLFFERQERILQTVFKRNSVEFEA